MLQNLSQKLLPARTFLVVIRFVGLVYVAAVAAAAVFAASVVAVAVAVGL